MKKTKIIAGAACMALVPCLLTGSVLAGNVSSQTSIKWNKECSIRFERTFTGNAGDLTAAGIIAPSSSLSMKSSYSAVQNLSGNDLAVYKVIHNKFKEVANGNITDTVLYISAKELKDAGWSVNTSSDYSGAHQLLNSNHDAFWKHKSAVLIALMSDDPVATAWYDKTVGVAPASESDLITRATPDKFPGYDKNTGYMYITKDTNTNTYELKGFWVSYAVIKDFQDSSAAQPKLTVKKGGDGMTRATVALKKANEIVNAAASKSDIEKIRYYNEQISYLTSYDTEYYEKNTNSDPSDDIPYGGQSEYFNVFDGNASTRVVCEGYSKAFKLLCNLTTWGGTVDCNIVTGNTDGGTGAGPHMWNIISYGGNNYLVDCTNNDEGTIGAPDKLLLAGVDSIYAPSTTVSGSVSNGYSLGINSSLIKYTYDSAILNTFTKAQLDLGRPVLQISKTPLEISVKKGKAVDNADLIGAKEAGSNETAKVTYKGSPVAGHFEWNSEVTSYGDFGSHMYKCRFVPDNSDAYAPIENITVKVNVRGEMLTVKYQWDGAPVSAQLPPDGPEFEYGVDPTPATEASFTAGKKISGEKDGSKGNYVFSGWDSGNPDNAGKAFIYKGSWSFEADTPMKKKYTITYNNGGGSGSMLDAVATEGEPFTLTECRFTAPENKEFKAWSIDGSEYQPGAKYTFSKATTVKALWKDKVTVPTQTTPTKPTKPTETTPSVPTEPTVPSVPDAPKYLISKGAGFTWIKPSTGNLSFTCSGDYSKFICIEIDGQVTPKDKYTSASGSTIVDLKSEYLNTLEAGSHKIVFVYTDGKTDAAEFTVANAQSGNNGPVKAGKKSPSVVDASESDLKKSPATGDKNNLAVSVFAIIASGAAAIGAIAFKRKRS